nr:alpha/beta fold hydrolase [Solimonas marina]
MLVHGAWHGAWCWERHFAPSLRARGHEVETLDLPGHGRPGPQRIGLYAVRDYVDAVEAALARRAVPTVVAGHSMGGFVVQKLMERRPAQLAGAALFAAAPPQGVIGVVLHLLRHRPLDLTRAVLGLDLYRLVREPRFAQALFYSDGVDAKTTEQYWRLLQNESFRAFLDMLVLDLPRPRRIDAALPKWVAGGECDVIFPPDIVRGTAHAYGVEAHLYPGMAHNLMLDRGWEQVAADFSGWLQALGAPAAVKAA